MNASTANPHPLARPLLLALAALAAAVSLLALLPSEGMAAKANFGADLSGPVSPVAAPEACDANPGAPCTRVPVYYDSPPHAGMVPFAPEKGVIKKIKLVASSPGKLRIQLAKVKGFDATAKAKIKRKGPRIKYQGTGAVEKFKVRIPVKKYEYLAFKTRYANTLQCGSGFDNEIQFQPKLPVGGPLASPSGAADCTHLIGARMKY